MLNNICTHYIFLTHLHYFKKKYLNDQQFGKKKKKEKGKI